MANENDKNWNETGYNGSDDNATDNYYDDKEENSYDYDEQNEDYELDDNSNSNLEVPGSKKKQMAVLLFLILVLLIVGVFLIVRMISNKPESNNEQVQNNAPAVEVNKDQELQNDLTNSFFDESSDKAADLMSVGFNENGEATVLDNPAQNSAESLPKGQEQGELKSDDLFGSSGDDALNPDENQQKNDKDSNKEATQDKNVTGQANNSIMVAWNKSSRKNPFKPPVIKMQYDGEEQDGIQFEIIEPPTRLVPDKNIEKLLQTQISGILYDEESPSAIVNLAGHDEFVKIGDEISGYKIKNITKNKVEISYKNNTYVAAVGELFIPGKLEAQPAVANLSNKFAGRYKNDDVEE